MTRGPIVFLIALLTVVAVLEAVSVHSITDRVQKIEQTLTKQTTGPDETR